MSEKECRICGSDGGYWCYECTPEDDFHPASMKDDRIYIGRREYIANDLVQSQIAAAVAAEREACAYSIEKAALDTEQGHKLVYYCIRSRTDEDNKVALEAYRQEVRAEALRVKPLEWKGRGAFCDFGVWQIVTDDDGDFGYRFSGSPNVVFWHWETEEEAKAAAQADYERRILSTLAEQEKDDE